MGKYFSIAELTRSTTAVVNDIDNTPNTDAVNRLNHLIETTLDPVRELAGRPITVNSGYRCEALNRAVMGTRGSRHLIGEAADITVGSVNGNRILFDQIAKSDIPFDQLIDERNYRWIHISCKYDASKNRRNILHL